eukprot:TRINITY_DN16785_c0_g1_i1.p1 TRINITY_DN16785_c0_g1~~TRINITY_DN16785_c0_g1_i1.p1  ORF type:complete len:186 (+),score=22.53 TRINITY_DN16785_c0_g1_i1:188-745(+)
MAVAERAACHALSANTGWRTSSPHHTNKVRGLRQSVCLPVYSTRPGPLLIKAEKGTIQGPEEEEKESLFTSITNALDFTAVRSEADAKLLRDAKMATKMGEKMTQQQYGALKRKVGGTAKDFFKEFIDVEGEYTETGWVDKTCRYCKKDTSSEPRQKDSLGRYAHIACAEEAASKGNFFTRLFSR